MADNVNPVMSVIVCNRDKLSDLAIRDRQLIFVRDICRIALDSKGKRTFFNQIITLECDDDRRYAALIEGAFYFVIGTSVLWTYAGGWVQVTSPPGDYVFIGVSLPELGRENVLYVDRGHGGILVWDDDLRCYVCVSDATGSISDRDICGLFE